MMNAMQHSSRKTLLLRGVLLYALGSIGFLPARIGAVF
jgi:hypothetical protein